MKEININGEKRYYLIKKKVEQASRINNKIWFSRYFKIVILF